jgi:hypothetical protein
MRRENALIAALFFPILAAIPSHQYANRLYFDGDSDDHPDENQAPLDPVDP